MDGSFNIELLAAYLIIICLLIVVGLKIVLIGSIIGTLILKYVKKMKKEKK